ncbi:divergent polysaccharide deacetylase family protein [Candidatus Liberibacter americanus]|uniref:Divergent polysaccharide deacetylase family protein n=1 Tax=Candidatus Liberibacter americanus str. Sao Paulo TaxID=1261131 RepID=U6B6B0_9HYPH|nr:divergent polysaccharide deacetylase family protein [Candidatus Liberibacter americanus]AHA28314.1 hypothetical protein lam_986 [Candidatus Liberibacter americanus str. Sao Paulo]EMS36605.1 hypothetical protein G653_00120 [Candidatus Liberibacter americanus PW_SP]
MSTNLNRPLGEKSITKRSFYLKIISRFGFCLLFSICVICLSIHIIRYDSFNGIVSKTDQYYFIPEISKSNSSAIDAVQYPEKSIEPFKGDNGKFSINKNNTVNVIDPLKTKEKKIISVNTNKFSSVIDPLNNKKEKFVSVIHKDRLVTNKSRGFLSIKDDNSSTSFEDYTKYCPDPGVGPRIAIVISGLGISKNGTQRVINLLPENFTLAFASNGNNLKKFMETSLNKGQETILQIPMQDFTILNSKDDPYVLKTNRSPKELSNIIYNSLNQATNYYGIMNYLGSSFLSDKSSIMILFNELANRKLFFLDDGSSRHNNISKELAANINLPYISSDLYLDYQYNRNDIRKKLKSLEYKARVSGKAIGVVVSFDENIEEILQWLKEDYMKDILIVPLSCLVKYYI